MTEARIPFLRQTLWQHFLSSILRVNTDCPWVENWDQCLGNLVLPSSTFPTNPPVSKMTQNKTKNNQFSHSYLESSDQRVSFGLNYMVCFPQIIILPCLCIDTVLRLLSCKSNLTALRKSNLISSSSEKKVKTFVN